MEVPKQGCVKQYKCLLKDDNGEVGNEKLPYWKAKARVRLME